MPPETDELVVDLPTDVVELPAGSPAAAVVDKPKTQDAAPAAPPAKDEAAERLARLERERDAERARAAQAEERARQAALARDEAQQTAGLREQQALNAHWARIHADRDQIVSAIASAEQREQHARAAFKAAREAGDADKEAEALAIIADSRSMIAQLESGKIAAERQIEDTRAAFQQRVAAQQQARTAEPARTEQPQPQQPVTPDAWIDGVRMQIGDTNAAWLREHKEFVTDPKLNRKLIRFADDFADDHGVDALRSEEFRKALDAKFFPDAARPAATEERQRPRVTTTSAPVSRGSSFFSSNNPNGTQVRLPPRLASFVKAAGLNPTEYALQAVADIKAGKLPKDFLDPDYPHDGA